MTSTNAVYCNFFLLVVSSIIGLATSFGPPIPFLPLESPRFLQEFRRTLPSLPVRSGSSPLLEHFGADVKYTDEPVEVQAGFYIRPRYHGRGWRLPPVFPQNVIPDFIQNRRQQEGGLFKPSKGGEVPETPGQVKAYEDDLQELEKERANEQTTRSFTEEATGTTFTEPATSFVDVGVTRGNKEEYRYNYSL